MPTSAHESPWSMSESAASGGLIQPSRRRGSCSRPVEVALSEQRTPSLVLPRLLVQRLRQVLRCSAYHPRTSRGIPFFSYTVGARRCTASRARQCSQRGAAVTARCPSNLRQPWHRGRPPRTHSSVSLARSASTCFGRMFCLRACWPSSQDQGRATPVRSR